MAQENKQKGDRTLDGLQSLVSQACGYMREAWRVTLQIEAQNEGRKTALPDNLLATPGTAKLQFYGLETLDRRLDGDLSRMILEMAQKVEQTAGPIEKWVHPLHAGAVIGSWGSLAVMVVTAIDRALELGKREWLNEDHIVGGEWEKAGRAGVTLQFACRAAKELERSIQAGELPAGSRVTKTLNPGSPVLDVQVLNAENLVIGTGQTVEAATADARHIALASKPYADLTLDQFIDITTVIEVESGRGKTGKAKHGDERLLFTGISSLSSMRQFLGRAFDTERREGRFEDEKDRKSWIDNSLRSLMATSFDESIKSMSFPGVGHLVFSRSPIVSMRDALAAIHRGYAVANSEPQDGLGLLEERDLPETPPPSRERLRA